MDFFRGEWRRSCGGWEERRGRGVKDIVDVMLGGRKMKKGRERRDGGKQSGNGIVIGTESDEAEEWDCFLMGS